MDDATWNIEGVELNSEVDLSGVSLNVTVKSGGTMKLINNTHLKFKGSVIVEKGGTINVDPTSSIEVTGTMSLNGSGASASSGARTMADSNNGILNNSGAFTIPADSKLTNNGIISNESTGTITNKGTIDNANGTIYNEGTFESVQTIDEMGGNIEGEVEPIDNTSSSSGGGCNAGWSLFGLLLAGLVTRKYRKA
jgi:hypothetical protein